MGKRRARTGKKNTKTRMKGGEEGKGGKKKEYSNKGCRTEKGGDGKGSAGIYKRIERIVGGNSWNFVTASVNLIESRTTRIDRK